MSVAERNRFLQILHKNGTTRKQVAFIMDDIDDSGIFYEDEFIEDDDGIESVADILWNAETSREEKKAAINSLKEERPVKKTGKTGKLLITEDMIRSKQRQYIDAGIVPEGDVILDEDGDEDILESNVRFGRSPLHEAIAYHDIDYVKKCIREKKYLDTVDNNGNTPREMAFYEGWIDVVKLFAEVN
jgi:hypothetical protein